MTTIQRSLLSQSALNSIGDPMELTSDLERGPADEDIDIDLDLRDERTGVGEDDAMGEDLKPISEYRAYENGDAQGDQDDEMFDEIYTPRLEEEVVSNRDEDVEDAEHIIQDSDPSDITDASELNDAAQKEQTSGQALHASLQDEPYPSESEPKPDTSESDSLNSIIANVDNPILSYASHELEVAGENGNTGEPHLGTGDSFGRQDHDGGELNNYLTASNKDLKGVVVVPKAPSEKSLLSNEAVAMQTSGVEATEEVHVVVRDQIDADDTTVSPGLSNYSEQIYLHPVIVIYQGDTISLFPPAVQDHEHAQTYFLQDTTLTNESIRLLLGSLRAVLADSISDQDELEVKIERLDLSFCESTIDDSFSNDESDTTLAHIVDLYLDLQRLDGVDDPDPLYLTLTTKTRFINRLQYLVSAVVKGKGLSQLSQLSHPNIRHVEESLSDLYDLEDTEAALVNTSAIVTRIPRTIHDRASGVETEAQKNPSQSGTSSSKDLGLLADHSQIEKDLPYSFNAGDVSTINISGQTAVEQAISRKGVQPSHSQGDDIQALEQKLDPSSNPKINKVIKTSVNFAGEDELEEWTSGAAILDHNIAESGACSEANNQLTNANGSDDDEASVEDKVGTNSHPLILLPDEPADGEEGEDLIDYEEDDPPVQEGPPAYSTVQGDALNMTLETSGADPNAGFGKEALEKHLGKTDDKHLRMDGNVYSDQEDATVGHISGSTTNLSTTINSSTRESGIESVYDIGIDGGRTSALNYITATAQPIELRETNILLEAKTDPKPPMSLGMKASTKEVVHDSLDLEEDEITYEEEEAIVEHDMEIKQIPKSEIEYPNSEISLKRLRGDDEGEDFLESPAQDIKRLRSNEKP